MDGRRRQYFFLQLQFFTSITDIRVTGRRQSVGVC